MGILLFLILINVLPNDKTSEKKKLIDGGKPLVRSLSKETMQMDLNKFSYREDIWELKVDMGKNEVLHIGYKII